MDRKYEVKSFPLQNLIHKIYSIEYTQTRIYNCFPCIYPVISFLINTDLQFKKNKLTIIEKKDHICSYLHFPYTDPFKIECHENTKEITFVFSPLCFHYFCPGFIYNTTLLYQNIKEIFPDQEVEQLGKQLLQISDTEKQVQEIESFLLQQLHTNFNTSNFPLPSFEEIYQKISALPPRSYYRKFKHLAFLAPKQFSKIIQVRKSLVDAKNDSSRSLTQIAYDHGYADQAHFTRSCKAMSKLSPTKIIRNFIEKDSDILWFT